MGGCLPPHSLLVTFDDAYADHYTTVFPILHQEHIQGAFFAPVKAITENVVLDVNKIHFIIAKIEETGEFGRMLKEVKVQLNRYKEEYQLEDYDYYFNKLAVANRFDTGEVVFVKRLLQRELPEELRNKITSNLFNQIIGIDEGAFSRELYMSMDQIKCMVDCGMHFGSHGYDHYWLSSLSKEKQQFEIDKSLEFIKAVGGDVKNWTICYPYGDYNDNTISILKKNGCKLGMTTKVDIVNTDTVCPNDVFRLPRLDTNDLPKDRNAEVNTWYR